MKIFFFRQNWGVWVFGVWVFEVWVFGVWVFGVWGLRSEFSGSEFSWHPFNSGRYQSMEIDDWKINRSIDGNRLRLVNSHQLASANRWTIDNHRKVVVNYINWHLLLTCYMFARVNVSFCSSPTTPDGVNLYWTLSSDVTAVTVTRSSYEFCRFCNKAYGYHCFC